MCFSIYTKIVSGIKVGGNICIYFQGFRVVTKNFHYPYPSIILHWFLFIHIFALNQHHILIQIINLNKYSFLLLIGYRTYVNIPKTKTQHSLSTNNDLVLNGFATFNEITEMGINDILYYLYRGESKQVSMSSGLITASS